MNPYLVIALLTILASSRPVQAQTDDQSLHITFGISGGIGMRQFDPSPSVQNAGAIVLQYKGKPERTGWCGCTYYSLNEQGKVVEVKFDEYNADINARLGIFRRNGNGWLFNAAYAFSRYSYSYKNVPFTFKGYTLETRNSDLESHGIMLGVAKFWHPTVFVRMSGLYVYKYTTGAFNKPVNNDYKLNFTENGTGFMVSLAKRSDNNFAVVPEVGVTSQKYPMELSVSVVVPLSQYAMSEQHLYYRNRQLIGKATTSYSTMTASINLRLIGFNLFKRSHRVKQQTRTPRPERVARQPRPAPESRRTVPAPTPSPVNSTDPPSVHGQKPESSRFERASADSPVQLKVYFDLEKWDLNDQSFPDLNQLGEWLQAHPTVRIRLEGHTDLVDEQSKNLPLSRQRVVAVKNYLALKGIASDRIETVGFGSSRPLKRDCPPPNYCPENRRVEMIILKR